MDFYDLLHSWPVLFIIGIVVICLSSFLLFKKVFPCFPAPDLVGKHVLITGGSEGIGFAVAEEVLKRGAHVTLVSRSRGKLEQAQSQLLDAAPPSTRKVHIRPFDVTEGGADEMVADAEATLGPVFMVVNCAGFSVPAKFEDITIDQMKMMMDVNFTGSFTVTQAVVRRMKRHEDNLSLGDARKRKGIIVVTSSQGGLLGIFGFTGYAATKAALVKFAEALHMELRPHKISVTVSLPPDTETPGFERENVSKPTECKLISNTAGLFKASEVAEVLVKDALAGNFFSYIGLDSFMLSNLCAGMGPITSLFDFLVQVFLSGPMRVISAFYLYHFSRIVKSEHEKRCNSKRKE